MKYFRALSMTALITVSSVTTAEDQWQYQLSPYVWFVGIEGDVAAIPGLPTVPIELSPSDTLKDTEASYMVLFKAQKNRHGLFIDTLYTDTQSDVELLPKLGLKVKSTSRNTLVSVGYSYELMNSEGALAEAFAGLRYWDVDTILTFNGDLLAGTKLKNREDWFDPLIGISGRTPVGNSDFFTSGWLAIGGFNMGSDFFYDATINVGYQWSDSIDTMLGYRLFDVDYEDGDYLYNVKTSGWVLGLSWRF